MDRRDNLKKIRTLTVEAICSTQESFFLL
jgi:hypothetical protein